MESSSSSSSVAVAESKKRQREEYEMQLFGFHSRAVYATLKSIVMDRIQSRNKKLCETLKKVYKPDHENSVVIEMNEEQLVKAYYTASLPHLKNLESIVNKFIAVPNNVVANEDKFQEYTRYTEAEFESMRTKLDELQQRAKRATILNAALEEELQLIEQFSICADNTEELSHIVENSVTCPDIGNKLHRLVKDYKRFSSSLGDGAPVSQKSLYNTIDGLKCTPCDMNTL